MSAPGKRKPKKVLIQLGVAALVALIVGGLAIGGVLMVVDSAGAKAKAAQTAAAEKEKQVQEELNRIKAAAAKQVKQDFKEVHALVDIAPGEPITQSQIELVDIDGPSSPGTITRLSDAIGQLATNQILAGEVLGKAKLMPSDGRIMVKEGLRAITIDVDSIGSISGALTPGSFIDILVTLDPKSDDAKAGFTKTLLQSIQVVSTNQPANNGQPNYSNSTKTPGITLAVTPKQAELLVLAQSKGKFHLTLRNFKDKTTVKLAGADIEHLVTDIAPGQLKRNIPNGPMSNHLVNYNGSPNEKGMVPVNYSGEQLPSPNVPQTPAKKKYSMTIYKGSGDSTVEFQ